VSFTDELVLSLAVKSDCDVVVLGSEGHRDLDVLFLDQATDPRDIASATRRFLPLAVDVKNLGKTEIVVRHEHRVLLAEGGRRTVHLLYYPSLPCLEAWEPPSFIAYVFDRGRFVAGDRTRLRQHYSTYRHREAAQPVGLLERQMYHYANITVTSLIYLATETALFPVERLVDELNYAARFAVTELLVDGLPPSHPISFWDWSELTTHLRSLKPPLTELAELLAQRDQDAQQLDRSQAVEFGLRLLELIGSRDLDAMRRVSGS